jgi:galactonate dehydratase
MVSSIMADTITRRNLLAAPGLACGLRAQGRPPLGKLKITRFVIHKATLRWRDLMFLEIHTDGGLVGIGEASLHTRVSIVEEALRWLEPHFVGLDPAGVEDHWDRMYFRMTRWRNGPVLVTAISAVDIALWDLEGKRLGVPVWRLLGGPMDGKVRPYFTHFDTYAQAGTPAELGAAAAAAKAKGWTACKFSTIGGRSETDHVERSAARVAAVRKAVGEEFDICLELGEGLTPRSAIRFSDAVAPYHPLFLEEVTWRENPEAMTEIAAKSRIPLATGEGLQTRFEFKRLFQAKAAAIAQPDVLHCGGITELRRIASLAEVSGVEVAPHQCYGPVAHVASLAAVSGCRNLLVHEWEAQDDGLFKEVTNGKYPTQQAGFLRLPDEAGLGIEMDFADFTRRFPYKTGLKGMPNVGRLTG